MSTSYRNQVRHFLKGTTQPTCHPNEVQSTCVCVVARMRTAVRFYMVFVSTLVKSDFKAVATVDALMSVADACVSFVGTS